MGIITEETGIGTEINLDLEMRFSLAHLFQSFGLSPGDSLNRVDEILENPLFIALRATYPKRIGTQQDWHIQEDRFMKLLLKNVEVLISLFLQGLIQPEIFEEAIHNHQLKADFITFMITLVDSEDYKTEQVKKFSKPLQMTFKPYEV